MFGRPICRMGKPAASKGLMGSFARAFTAIVAVAFTMGTASVARAAGFASARFGGEHGSVVATNPTALYYNPAGIAFGPHANLYVDGVLALRRGSWDHSLSPSEAGEPAAETGNAGRASFSNVFGAPMAGAAIQLGRVSLGAAVFVPFGGRLHWNKNEQSSSDPAFAAAADGAQRWTITEGALTYLYLTGGIAYRFGRVALGATANVVRSSVQNTQAKNPTGAGDPDSTHEGRDVLDVRGTHLSFGLGAMVEAVKDRLWLGASYQARPGFGPMKLDGTLVVSYQGASITYPVQFTEALPDIVRAGARYRPVASLELRLFGDWTRWSALQTQCMSLKGHACAVFPDGRDATADASTVMNLRRFWNDSFGLRAGASYFLSDRWELFAGLGFETAAVPDATLDPALPDADNIMTALGARVEIAHALYVAASYTDVRFLARNNTGKSELARAEPPTRRADGGGAYSLWLGLFNLNVEKQF
jgi:long-chain fatty acid transport protein